MIIISPSSIPSSTLISDHRLVLWSTQQLVERPERAHPRLVPGLPGSFRREQEKICNAMEGFDQLMHDKLENHLYSRIENWTQAGSLDKAYRPSSFCKFLQHVLCCCARHTTNKHLHTSWGKRLSHSHFTSIGARHLRTLPI